MCDAECCVFLCCYVLLCLLCCGLVRCVWSSICAAACVFCGFVAVVDPRCVLHMFVVCVLCFVLCCVQVCYDVMVIVLWCFVAQYCVLCCAVVCCCVLLGVCGD